MTKEERAVKWFENVPGAEQLSMEERMEICSRIAKETAAVFLALFVAEFILMYLAGGGEIVNQLADVTNRFVANSHGTRQYKSLALFSVIFYLPLFVFPFVAGAIYRRNRLRAAAKRAYSGRDKEPATQMSQTNIPQGGMNKNTDVGNTTVDTGSAWLKRWEQIRARFDCKIDLESYFKKQKIGEADLDVLDLGKVHFSTGQVAACDPFVGLDKAAPYIQTIPAGMYPVKICVADSNYGIRYACVKVEVSDKNPVRYELAMTGKEKLDQEFDEDDFFGFGVDAGMACIADQATQVAFHSYWQERWDRDHSIDPFNDLFSDLLEENYKKHPKYQSELGDWLNWRVPGTDCDLPIFSSGFGDGFYPVYFGYDAAGKVSGIYVHFIDVETEFCGDDAEAEAPGSSGEKYSAWAMEIDGTEQTVFTMKEIGHQLEAIKNGDTEFMILTPSEPIQTKSNKRVCSFVQICRDENPEYFHFEVSIANAGQRSGSVIYGKDRMSGEEVRELLQELLDNNVVPNFQNWEIVLEMRTEKEDMSPEKDIAPYKRIAELVIEDTAILSKLESCFRSPQKYLHENIERYEDRAFEGDEADDKIIWIGIADEMIAVGAAAELDWKTEKEEFLRQMKTLSDKHHLELRVDWLEEDGDIPAWCSVLDAKWSEQGLCVAAIDIDSDSYVLFVCKREILKRLTTLGKEVNHRFDFAKNM